MKICIVGDFSANLDEGYKNTGHYLASELEKRHTVVRLNTQRLGHPAFMQQGSGCQPDIVHLITQPTCRSLVAARLLRCRWPQARVIVSALRAERLLHQRIPRLSLRWCLHIARPDLMLVQSSGAATFFRTWGCPVAYLPNGVDLHRFHPATQKHKRHLRRRYGLDEERPTVLHVGHLEPARNLSALAPLSKAGMQVVVAGSLYMGTDHRLITHLEQAGYCLFKGYQPRVEDLYMLADCYAFPPAPGDSLTMPLSVLEAMACNLPVATTRFRGLTEIFRENASFRYVEAPSRIPHAVEALLASQGPRTTRYMVQPFAWMSIAERLQGYYHQALAA